MAKFENSPILLYKISHRSLETTNLFTGGKFLISLTFIYSNQGLLDTWHCHFVNKQRVSFQKQSSADADMKLSFGLQIFGWHNLLNDNCHLVGIHLVISSFGCHMTLSINIWTTQCLDDTEMTLSFHRNKFGQINVRLQHSLNLLTILLADMVLRRHSNDLVIWPTYIWSN